MPAQVKDASIHDTRGRADRRAADAASETSDQARCDTAKGESLRSGQVWGDPGHT
jgi:hypothetical protein